MAYHSLHFLPESLIYQGIRKRIDRGIEGQHLMRDKEKDWTELGNKIIYDVECRFYTPADSKYGTDGQNH